TMIECYQLNANGVGELSFGNTPGSGLSLPPP
ncbi:unnamed protein product, partial [marine sediment metagenome]